MVTRESHVPSERKSLGEFNTLVFDVIESSRLLIIYHVKRENVPSPKDKLCATYPISYVRNERFDVTLPFQGTQKQKMPTPFQRSHYP